MRPSGAASSPVPMRFARNSWILVLFLKTRRTARSVGSTNELLHPTRASAPQPAFSRAPESLRRRLSFFLRSIRPARTNLRAAEIQFAEEDMLTAEMKLPQLL